MEKARILIVEDEAIISMDIKGILEGHGYTVADSAISGEEAVEKASRLKPDLILMDILLAGKIDGIEAAVQIRKKHDIPIIYITSYSDEAKLEKAKITEPYAYIIKPIKEKELYSNIEAALNRHNLELKLKKSAEKYRRIADQSFNVIFTLDSGGFITYISPSLERYTGYRPGEIEGTSFKNLLPPNFNSDELKKVLSNAQKGPTDGNFILSILRKDRKTIEMEINLFNIFENGALTEIQGVMRNVEEQKILLNALHVSEEKLRLVSEAMTDVIVKTNAQGLILYANPSIKSILGYDPESMAGRSIFEHVHPNDLELTVKFYNEKVKALKPGIMEIRYQHAIGHYLWIEVIGNPLVDSEGRFMGGTISARDITERKAIEKALKESEEQYRNLIKTAPEAIILTDIKGKIIIVNKMALHLLGYDSEEEIIRNLKNLIDLIPQREKRHAIRVTRRLLEEGSIHDIEFSAIRKDKMLLPVEASVSLIIDYNKNPINLLYVFRDITARKRVEKALRDSEERYRRMVSTVTTYTYSVEIINGKTVSSKHSLGCIPITGYNPRDYASDPNLWYSMIHPDDRHKVEKITDAIINGQDIPPIEHRIYRRNGTLIWIRNTIVPHFDENGILVRYDGMVEDISERKLAEEALRISEKRFSLALEATSDGLWDYNLETGETYMNARYYTMLGYDPYEISLSFKSWDKVLHPDDLENAENTILELVNGNRESYEIEFRMKTKSGKWHWVLDRARVVEWNQNGKPLRMVGTHVDIQERKTNEEQIKKSLAEKELLLKEVHHRVKNNMSVISSLLSLQSGYVQDPKAVEVLSECRNRIYTMLAIYEKLYKSDDMTHINFKSYVNDLINSLFETYNMHPEKVKIDIEIGDVPIDIERAMPFGLIINELISNSLKHGFQGEKSGNIFVKISGTENHKIELMVSDNGKGMPDNFNIDKTGTMGLQLVTMMVKQLDGEIQVKSRKGTEFKILFNQ